jgi:hypothetical protein
MTSSSSSRSLPSFGRAVASRNTASLRTLRGLRFTTFQQYHVCGPLFFQRLLLPQSGLAPFSKTSLCPKSKERQRLSYIFPRRFHAHICYVSLRSYAQLSRIYGSCSIAATPPTALLIRTLPLSLHFGCSLRCLGIWLPIPRNIQKSLQQETSCYKKK